VVVSERTLFSNKLNHVTVLACYFYYLYYFTTTDRSALSVALKFFMVTHLRGTERHLSYVTCHLTWVNVKKGKAGRAPPEHIRRAHLPVKAVDPVGG